MIRISSVGRPPQRRNRCSKRGEGAVVGGVVDRPPRGRLGQRGAAVVGLERGAAHPAGGGLAVGADQPGDGELLADPGRLLAERLDRAEAAGRRVDRDGHRLVREGPVADRDLARGRRGPVGVGLAGDPGEAEGGEVNHGLDAVLGELRDAERPLGPEVGRGVGEQDRDPSGDAQRVHHQVAGPAGRAFADDLPGERFGLGRQEPVDRPAGLAEAAGLQRLLGLPVPAPRPRSRRGQAEARAWVEVAASSRARSRACSARAAIGEGSRRAAAWAR